MNIIIIIIFIIIIIIIISNLFCPDNILRINQWADFSEIWGYGRYECEVV